MREMIKMVIVLTVLSALSGGLLAAVRSSTKTKIEEQQLKFVKGPAIKTILTGVSNDPIADRFILKDGDTETLIFVGKIDSKPELVAFESSAAGVGGPVGLMVGINLKDDKIVGVGVTTHSETPGLGARAKDDPSLAVQFQGLSVSKPITVTKDGGQINAISGATITSRAVCAAATEASSKYLKIKSKLSDELKKLK